MIAIEKRTNTGKFMAVVAILALALCVFAVAMPAENTDAAGETTYISGTITSEQNFSTNTVVVVNDDLVIPDNMTLTVASPFRPAVNSSSIPLKM